MNIGHSNFKPCIKLNSVQRNRPGYLRSRWNWEQSFYKWIFCNRSGNHDGKSLKDAGFSFVFDGLRRRSCTRPCAAAIVSTVCRALNDPAVGWASQHGRRFVGARVNDSSTAALRRSSRIAEIGWLHAAVNLFRDRWTISPYLLTNSVNFYLIQIRYFPYLCLCYAGLSNARIHSSYSAGCWSNFPSIS